MSPVRRSCSEGSEADCQFIPELTQNTSATSSLLAAPFLDSVINFCDAASHNAAAPTKHNLLCDQMSVKEVMARHADMSGNSPISLASTNFTVVNAMPDWPRTALLVENTTAMAWDGNGKQVTTNSSPVLLADVTAVVANKDSQGASVNITLNDNGIGADVTGQDGVYSGYLVGFQPQDSVDITLTATDNNGLAMMVTPSLRAAPTTQGAVACCGSKLNVSSLQLTATGNFAFTSSAVSGRFTGVSPGTLPPGQVTDLQAFRTGRDVTLSFTAPGAQLDQGEADWYAVQCQVGGADLSPIGNISGVAAGSPVEEQVTLPDCNKVYTLTVVAYYNGVHGSVSNGVREMAACSSTSGGLSAGAIAGITIGCILGVLLIVLLVYLGLNSDHLDDLWVWRMLTCRCCPWCKDTKDDDDLYSPPSQARRTDFIRGNNGGAKPVRSLADLYSRPSVGVKKEQQQTSSQDEDDGGFGERMKQNKMQMKAVEDGESLASSHSTLPINQVGLPVGSDNHAYDDGPYTSYRTAPPVPARRANTQV